MAVEPQQARSGSDLSQKQSPVLKFHGKKTQKQQHQLINPNRQVLKKHISLYFCRCFWEFMTGEERTRYAEEMVELTIPSVEVKWSAAPSWEGKEIQTSSAQCPGSEAPRGYFQPK